jgi:hypothetical protein
MAKLNTSSSIALRIIILLLAIALASMALTGCAKPSGTSTDIATQGEVTASSDEVFQKLFDEKKSDVAVNGQGTVLRQLSDDNEGDRHQRFILELQSGQTLLVAHNIDIAPRVEPLDVGDTVEFAGEYVWNDQGGIIHWTHHDPDGSHAAGFIKANGLTFQ